MKFVFSNTINKKSDVIILSMFANSTGTNCIDDKIDTNFINKTIKSNKFKGKKGEILEIISPPKLNVNRILIVGIGEKLQADIKLFQEIGGIITNYLWNKTDSTAQFLINNTQIKELSDSEINSHIAYGMLLKSWSFNKYFTKEKKTISLKKFTFLVNEEAYSKKIFNKLSKISDGVFLTRELISEPSNVMFPKNLIDRVKKELSDLNIKINILNKRDMQKLGMNALLGVAQGSSKEPFLMTMQWNGGEKTEKPIAFVGKGVCFDSGGLSLKPSQGMSEQKTDMSGAAVVIGLMKSLAGRKAKVNAIGVIGLVENMPSGSAQHPGDIVYSMSGQTIEILNTDAEGRLLLADALWYTQDKFNPQVIIDLATLTGAIIIALGSEYAGAFSNNDELISKLTKVGEKTDEKIWRLPLNKNFDKLMNSEVADMQNISKRNEAGSITAAQFLQRFIKDNIPWVHLDIAGVSWSHKNLNLSNKGATGFGVRLLDKFISEYYEKA